MPASAKPLAGRVLERGLFLSRWLMAPFYAGMVFALLALLAVFVAELVHEAPHVLQMKADDAILLVLSLIDLSLAGNLALIVTLAGYEHFVSRFSVSQADRPAWLDKVDFSDLKMKLIASIVAISGIALLRAFMELDDGHDIPPAQLMLMVGIHLTLVATGVLLALMDWLTARSHRP
jgi:uncharacterized protein (TIGR00645 family)